MLLTVEGSKTKREWEIPIPTHCLPDILNLRKKTEELKPGSSLDDEQVFRVQLFNPRYVGTETTPEQIGGAFRKLSDRLGVRIMPHRLRHTMATELGKGRNPDLKSLQFVLGHTDIRTTLGYVSPQEDQIREFLSQLDL